MRCESKPANRVSPKSACVCKVTGNHDQFLSTARYWTETYALEASQVKEIHPAVQRLMDMGFEEARCREAFLEAKGDENAAIEKLLV